jgi:hypothetical protein
MDTVEIPNGEIKRKTSRLKRGLLYVLISLILLALIGYVFRLDRFGLLEVDFLDCVYINNQLYFSGSEQHGGERIPIDPALIGRRIGEVKFTLSEKVHSSYYINRNGDAAFLDIGTGIYSLKSNDKAIAVKLGGNYFEFTER